MISGLGGDDLIQGLGSADVITAARASTRSLSPKRRLQSSHPDRCDRPTVFVNGAARTLSATSRTFNGGLRATTLLRATLKNLVPRRRRKRRPSRRRRNDTADITDKTQSRVVTLNGGDTATVFVKVSPRTRSAIAKTSMAGSGNDVLTGGRRNNVLRGEAGNDILNGGDGDDSLFGAPQRHSRRGKRG